MIQFPLDKGERLLWSGEPRHGLVLRPSDLVAIPFSLLWAGFAVFWEVSVFRTGAPLFFRLWGIPFVLMGCYIAVGRFFHDAWRRARRSYGLTSHRVIIASSGFGANIKSLDLATLGDIRVTERPDGSGTIAFGPEPTGRRRRNINGEPSGPAFDLIPSVRGVYDMVRQAQQESRTYPGMAGGST